MHESGRGDATRTEGRNAPSIWKARGWNDVLEGRILGAEWYITARIVQLNVKKVALYSGCQKCAYTHSRVNICLQLEGLPSKNCAKEANLYLGPARQLLQLVWFCLTQHGVSARRPKRTKHEEAKSFPNPTARQLPQIPPVPRGW